MFGPLYVRAGAHRRAYDCNAKKKAAAEAEGTVTIHKVDYPKKGDCGQTTVDAASAHWPEQFGKFVAGACSSAGYSVADGQQTVTIPVWGKKVTFDLFKKAAAEAEGTVTIHKVDYPKKGDCGQTTVDAG